MTAPRPQNQRTKPVSDKRFAQHAWRIPELLLWCFLFVFFVNQFTAFTPAMVGPGIDLSWVYGLNQAVAQGMTFGKDIIFTFGPYASVYTHSYHPATVRMMESGVILLDAWYLACFAWLVKDARWRWPMILACILVVPLTGQDAFLFSAPLLAALILIKLHFPSKAGTLGKASTRICIVFAFACLGLLPLVKGTLILLTAGICLACAAFLLVSSRWVLALVCLVAPGMSMVVFWVASGQPLQALPEYLSSMKFIISGYSEAMSMHGPRWQLLLFLAGAAVVLSIIAANKMLSISQKVFLLLIYALFFFIAFKAGFVRQDFHYFTSMACLAIGSLFLLLLNCNTKASFDARKLLAIALLAISHASLNQWHINFNVEARTVDYAFDSFKDRPIMEMFGRLQKDIGGLKLVSILISSEPWQMRPWGFRSAQWQEEFEQAKGKINETSKLNYAMPGTVDIYSYEQSSLLAKGYRWNPRPVFQSYSAYTPELIRINEQHLRYAAAPDYLVFRLQPFDDDFPSLDDGLSWPAILDNYTVAGSANDWIYLKHSSMIKTVSQYAPLGQVVAQLGQKILVPTATGPVFVEVNAKPSAIGKLLALIYKVPSLALKVTMRNGKINVYRVNANMMETGFILSPLVATNEDLLRLFDPNTPPHEEDKVQSIVLNVSGGRTICWKKHYRVTFKQYEY